ncbi:restriction endonuclease [Longimicrobium sp.]|uniref:restriction endonuclease n=1 Tax=Longimicrobium sp. TaxID=2029185 RepID=UPI002B733617|nr:restriction endonuclease [Longimicrobium sp.]HSU15815.1 restriction endonuclease [Longimicrobium sp.]
MKALIEAELHEGNLGLDPACATVFHQKGYRSLQRGSDIVVDLAIELRMKGASDPYLVWVWECKGYTHPVRVDDIEEFHAKLQQIGADRTKGTVVTRSTFQKSAVRFAKANGIGLARAVPGTGLDHVMYHGLPPTQEELAAGLIAGESPDGGAEFYGLCLDGRFTGDFAEFLESGLPPEMVSEE